METESKLKVILPFTPTEAILALPREVLRLATAADLELMTVESCTGGLVAHLLSLIPGCSSSLHSGMVVYQNAAKTSLAGVPHEILANHGAVSAVCAAHMATGALLTSGADLAVAITGIAGPTGDSPGKPVGTIYWALARSVSGLRSVFRGQLPWDRHGNQYAAAEIALHLLAHDIRDTPTDKVCTELTIDDAMLELQAWANDRHSAGPNANATTEVAPGAKHDATRGLF